SPADAPGGRRRARRRGRAHDLPHRPPRRARGVLQGEGRVLPAQLSRVDGRRSHPARASGAPRRGAGGRGRRLGQGLRCRCDETMSAERATLSHPRLLRREFLKTVATSVLPLTMSVGFTRRAAFARVTPGADDVYDIVIIGGGLAGLTAARD